MKLRLILDVTYNANGVSEEALRRRLADVVRHAMSQGLVTGDTAAFVTDHDYRVHRVEEGEDEAKD